MLHNTTREALLQQKQGYTALVIDALYFLGLEAYTTFTIVEAFDWLQTLGLSTKAIRKGLKSALFGRGRKRGGLYTLPASSTVRKAVQADTSLSLSDELDGQAFSSLKAYRMALHRALVRNRPNSYMRWILARRLGVCKQTTRNYDRQMSLKFIASYKYHAHNPDLLAIMPADKEPAGKYFLMIAHQEKYFYAPFVLGIFWHWDALGAKVDIVEQVGNLYSP